MSLVLLLSASSLLGLISAAPCENTVPSGLTFCSSSLEPNATIAVPALTASAIDNDARALAGELSNTACTEESCSLGSATCAEQITEFACRWAAAPLRDWTLGQNCDDATLATPSLALCESLFDDGCLASTVTLETMEYQKNSLCLASGPLDFSPPVLTGCEDIQVRNNTASIVDFQVVVATDEQSGVASESYDPADDQYIFPVGGSTSVVYSAVDGAGNRNGCTYSVVIGVCATSDECQNGGACLDGLCECPLEYYGDFCELLKVPCPSDTDPTVADLSSTCSNKGDCDYSTGTCICIPPFSGAICSEVDCPGAIPAQGIECNGHGRCDKKVGVCQCDMAYLGFSCQVEIKESGMTSGQLAGAVIGGLVFSFIFLTMLIAYVYKDD